MIFEEIFIRGFGNLSNLKVEFGEGLNLFVAPNEAGKSTLAECLFRCLYGFQALRTESEKLAYRRFKPASGERYSARLRMATDRQTTYELERDFAARTLRVRNAVTGEDVTGQFPVEKKGQDVLFAENLLGINRDTFRSVAFLAQGLVDRLENGQELSAEIRKMADSGEHQTDYRKALERLDKALNNLGTVERVSSKPLREAQDRVAQLHDEHAVILGKRGERAAALERIEQLKEKLDRTETARAQLETKRLMLLLARIQSTLKQVETLEKEIQQARDLISELDQFRNVPRQHRDELFLNADRSKNIGERLAEQQRLTASLDEQIETVRKALAETDHLANLPEKVLEKMDVLESTLKRAETEIDLLDGKISQNKQTRERIRDQLSALSTRLQGFTGEMGKDPLAFEQQLLKFDRISALEREVGLRQERVSNSKKQLAHKRRSFHWVAMGAALVLFVIVGALKMGSGSGHAVGWGIAGGVAAFLFAHLALRLLLRSDLEQFQQEQASLQNTEAELATVEQERQQQLSSASVSSLRELRELFHLYRNHQAELENHQTLLQHLLDEYSRHEEERNNAQEQIQQHLVQCKLARADEPFQQEALERLRSGHRDRSAKTQQNEALVKKRNDLIQQIAESRQELETLDKKVEAVLKEANVESLERFDEVCSQKERLVQMEQQLENLEQQRRLLVGESSEAELADQEKHIKSQLSDLGAVTDSSAPDPKQLQTVQQQLQEHDSTIQNLRAGIAHEEGQQKGFWETSRSLAEVEEELEQAQADFKRLMDYRDALVLAKNVIEESARDFHEQVFAPEMGKACGELISKVTAGRYNEIRLEKDLNQIHVIAPDHSQIEGSFLSRGAVEQVYFALRVAMGDFLTRGRQRVPLVLDDTFANTDDQRLGHIAELLLRLAEKTQIIVLTCHPFQRDTITRAAGDAVEWKRSDFGTLSGYWL